MQVPEPDTGDEIQTLGQSFNRMTQALKQQRLELVDSYRATDEQRRLFDSVLTSVTAGVIGLGHDGRIDFVNRSALRLLGLDPTATDDMPLLDVVPEFGPLFARRRDRSPTACRTRCGCSATGASKACWCAWPRVRPRTGPSRGM